MNNKIVKAFYSLIILTSISYSVKSQDLLIENDYVYFNSYTGTEKSIKEYLKTNINTLDLIEGIWSANSSVTINGEKFSDQGSVKFAIIKDKFDNSKYNWIILEATNEVYVFLGAKKYDILGELNKTFYPNVFIEKVFKQKFEIINQPHTYNLLIDKDGLLTCSFEYYATPDYYITGVVNDIKIFPSYSDYNTSNSSEKPKNSTATGTGFAINQNGYIVTCNHVIDGAKSIKIKGVNGDFSKAFSAKVINSDINNDLAILKIDDANFTTCGPIPYVIKSPTSEVGTSIYILGYPLTATMGDEIKLTDGIISAKSGFKGDITSYQVSAAAQPGNSGGPLFDKSGNLIGVLNAKHVEAENASYAVKSNYLTSLIESLPTTITLQKVNGLVGKTMTDQVKIIKKFVYLIEVTL